MPKLKYNQPCPIPGHGFRCACRTTEYQPRRKSSKWETVRPGVRRIKDEHADHPDGYRYKLSKSEMQKVVDKKIAEQNGLCGICHKEMTDYSNIAPDHILPKGNGGARADDRPANIQAVHHFPCNTLKGSQRNFTL